MLTEEQKLRACLGDIVDELDMCDERKSELKGGTAIGMRNCIMTHIRCGRDNKQKISEILGVLGY